MIEPQATDKHWAVLEKYANIQEGGEVGVSQGTLSVFNGFGPDFATGFQVVLLPSRDCPNTQGVLERRVSAPLERVGGHESPSCAGLLVAGEDYDWHFTVLDSKFNGNSAEVQARFLDIQSDGRLRKFEYLLDGLHLKFPYLINAATNLILATPEIPTSIILARSELAGIFRTHGFEPLSMMENILHATAARMHRLPPRYKAHLYNENVERIEDDIFKDPLKVVTGKP